MRPKTGQTVNQIFLGQPTWNDSKFLKFGLKKANLATLCTIVLGLFSHLSIDGGPSYSFSTIYTNLMDTFFSLISQTSTDVIRNSLHVQV